MDKLTPQLNEEQLKQNIDILKAKGVDTAKIQSYVNNYQRSADGSFVLKGMSQPVEQKSIGEKLMDTGTAVTDFIGGKAIADTFGSAIAKATVPEEQKQFVSEGPSLKETVGSALQVGSLFLPVGSAAKGISLGAKALGITKGANLIGNVGAGAIAGGTFDVGEKLQTGETSGMGTILGTTIPLVGPVAGLTTKAIGRVAGETLGKTTGVGFGAIKEGFESSLAGGERAKAFTSALRGKVSPIQLVEEAVSGLDTIIANRRNTYVNQLAKIAENKSALDISPVINEVGEQLNKFNISVLDDGTLDFSRSAIRFDKVAQSDINDILNEMRGFGLKQGDRTAVGVDLLKRALADKYSNSSSVRAFVQAVKSKTDDVLKNVEGYQELAKNYADSTELITDIRRGLSLGDKASVETSFKKLTSALRQNNEMRREFIQELDNVTGGFLSSKIAGQQLSELLPRGLSGVLATAGGVGGAMSGIAIPSLLKIALVTSPRLIGEVVNALGFTGKNATKLTNFLTKNVTDLEFPGDTAVKGLRKDIQTIKETPNKQGGFVKVGNSTDNTLIQEARKYKSAEEFVRKQPVAYHGSSVPLKQFSNKKGGVFFTSEYADATGYAGGLENVYEGYLNFKKPLVIDAKGAKWDNLNTKYGKSTQEIVGKADKDGYDGIIFKNIVDNVMDTEGMGESTVYYAYKPKDAFVNESQLEQIWKEANKK